MDKSKRDQTLLPERRSESHQNVLRSRRLKVAIALSTALLLAMISILLFFSARPTGTDAWGRLMWNEGNSALSFVTLAEDDLDGHTVLMIGGTSRWLLSHRVGLRERKAMGFSWNMPRQIGGGVWQLRIPYWFLIALALILDVGCVYLLRSKSDLTKRFRKP